MNRRIALSAALAILSGLPGPAGAFEILHTDDGTPIRWRDAGAIALTVFTPEPGLLPAPQQAVEAVQRALATWSEVDGAEVGFETRVEPAGTPAPALGFDRQRPSENVNAVVFIGESWSFDPGAYAVTLRTVSSTSGHLLDADVAVNVAAHVWRVLTGRSAAEPEGRGPADVESVMTHEIGHLVGLEHNELDQEVTMYPTLGYGEVWMRTLAEDDRAGGRYLYPEAADEATRRELREPELPADEPAGTVGAGPITAGRVGCSSSAGGASGWALLLAIAALALGRTQSARTRLGLVLLALLAPAAARATTVADRPLPVLAAKADVIVRGTVLRTESRWEGGLLVTEVVLATRTCLKGPCGFTVAFVQPGGERDGLRQEVAGAVVAAPGEELVVLLDRRGERRVPFLAGGVWEVVRDADGRELVQSRGGPWRLESWDALRELLSVETNGSEARATK